MKYCSKCKTDKPLEAFSKNSRKLDGKQVFCKECVKTVNADYYLRSPEQTIKRRAWKEKQTTALQDVIFEHLSKNPCVDCGEADVLVLEFDHVSGTKLYNIADIVRKALSVQVLLEEIAKCEVRCANDHRRVTAKRAGSWRTSRI